MTRGADWLTKRVAGADGLPVVLPTTQMTTLVVSRFGAAGVLLASAVVAGIAARIDKAPGCYGDVAGACVLVLAGVGSFMATSPETCSLVLTCQGFVFRRFLVTHRWTWAQVGKVTAGPENRYGLPVVRVTSGPQLLTVAGCFDVQANDLAGAMEALRRRAPR